MTVVVLEWTENEYMIIYFILQHEKVFLIFRPAHSVTDTLIKSL